MFSQYDIQLLTELENKRMDKQAQTVDVWYLGSQQALNQVLSGSGYPPPGYIFHWFIKGELMQNDPAAIFSSIQFSDYGIYFPGGSDDSLHGFYNQFGTGLLWPPPTKFQCFFLFYMFSIPSSVLWAGKIDLIRFLYKL